MLLDNPSVLHEQRVSVIISSSLVILISVRPSNDVSVRNTLSPSIISHKKNIVAVCLLKDFDCGDVWNLDPFAVDTLKILLQ